MPCSLADEKELMEILEKPHLDVSALYYPFILYGHTPIAFKNLPQKLCPCLTKTVRN